MRGWRSCAVLGTALAAVAVAASSAWGISVSVAPSHLVIPAGQTQDLTISNPGSDPVTFDLSTGNYVLSANGQVQIDPKQPPARSAKDWIRLSPSTVTIDGQQSATIHVATKRVSSAAPGDHQALVFITSRATSTPGSVGVQTRLGIGVVVRVPGTLIRRLRVNKPTVATRGGVRVLQVRITNAGNINERFEKGQVRVTLRTGAAKTVLIAKPQNVLPGTYGIFSLPYRGKLTGTVKATATVRPGSPQVVGAGIASTPPPITTTATVVL